MIVRGALAAILVAAAAMPASAADADVSSFYSGLQMKMVIRSAPGGSYDTYGRLVARHIVRHIPGNPTMIAVNMPGASGIKAANYIAEIAPKDGSIITNISLGFPMYQAMGQLKAVKTDMRDFNWLGTLNVILQVGLQKEHDLPNVPLLIDQAKTPEDRAVLEFITKSNASIGKPFATSPGVPPERVAALRHAFDAAMKDKQLIAEAETMHIEIDPIDGAGIQKIVTDIVTTPKPVIERVKDALGITAETSLQ